MLEGPPQEREAAEEDEDADAEAVQPIEGTLLIRDGQNPNHVPDH